MGEAQLTIRGALSNAMRYWEPRRLLCQVTLMKRVTDKLDLMTWALFRDEVLPTLPVEIHAHVDKEEYLAMKLRLVETLELCLAKTVGEADSQ
jgi:hypothetical protein